MGRSPGRDAGDGASGRGTVAGSRSALIVATYLHDDPGLTRLQAPAEDAEALAEILSDADVGGFDVSTVVNGRWSEVNLAVAQFFHDRRPDDLLLLHFSCHGLKDDSGELYFAATDTRLDLLEATGIPSSFVSRTMDRSRAGRVLLLLDCCYAGAFARSGAHRGAGAVDVGDRLGGRGRVVITAASALQYAFEGKELTQAGADDTEPSVFTGALVRGLRTGEADRDSDGWVSLDELYAYVYDEVRSRNPNQTPKKWAFDIEGDVFIARRAGPVTQPSELPAPIRESMESLLVWEREAAVQPLRELLKGQHPGRSLGARLALEHLAATDDSAKVRAAAAATLAEVPVETRPPSEPTEPTPPEPSEAPQSEPTHAEVTEPDVAEPDVAEPEPPQPETVHAKMAEAEVAEPESPQPETVHAKVAEPEVDGPRTTVPPTPVSAEPARSRRPGWWGAAAAGAALLLVVTAVWAWSRLSSGSGGGEQPAALTRSEMVIGGAAGLTVYDEGSGSPVRTVPGTRDARMPAISPDRQWIVYLAPDAGAGASDAPDHSRLRMVRTDGSHNQSVIDDASCPYTTRAAWSPDGTRLAFVCLVDRAGSNSEGLYTYDVDGSSLVRVLKAQPDGLPSGLTIFGPPTWSADTQIIFDAEKSGHERSLWQVSATPGSTPEPMVTPRDGYSDEFPAWSSDGLLFLRCRIPGHEECDVMVKPGDATAAALLSHPTGPGYRLGPATWGPGPGEVTWTRWSGDRTVMEKGTVDSGGTLTADPSWHPDVPDPNQSQAWGTPRPAQ
jgi:caspase domain-containing protein/WD40 repeat protein